ncbi:hypothetical protein FHS16_001929 [Paenibacillus endophyticus]|uniref:Uncharacterized protein n=1 Tax=Paenibacillus endophyticus TaxID=1294268 RepID=A0A7W5GA34_9BACL|nr:hypothetical protein [Paenibacillus endophyticus]MBB3151883.1 hypothetical protein [Paenibacillus endophyticus]
MNYKMIFKNAALSTLLLSAVAGPTVFADSAHTNTKLDRVTAISSTHLMEPIKLEAIASTAAFQLIDPIKLAETYAKDSVKEWQAVIAQYDSLVSKRFEAVSIGEVNEAGVALPRLSLSSKELSLSTAAPTTLQAVPVSEKELASIKAYAVDHVSAQLTSVPLHASGTIAVAGTTTANSAIEIKVSPFFNGMIALEKAVKANDEVSIREALAKQLELYKQEITSLLQDGDHRNK